MRAISLFFLLFIQHVIAQEANSDKIVTYKAQPKLNWNSFKAKPPSNTPFAASVNTGLDFEWSYSTAENKIDLQYSVESYVQPYFSWVIEKEKDEELLTHEQLHFEIAELHARKFRKRLKAYEFGRNIRKAMTKIHGDIEFEMTEMQKVYDKESKHSKDTIQQRLWEAKVANMLKEYNDYSE